MRDFCFTTAFLLLCVIQTAAQVIPFDVSADTLTKAVLHSNARWDAPSRLYSVNTLTGSCTDPKAILDLFSGDSLHIDGIGFNDLDSTFYGMRDVNGDAKAVHVHQIGEEGGSIAKGIIQLPPKHSNLGRGTNCIRTIVTEAGDIGSNGTFYFPALEICYDVSSNKILSIIFYAGSIEIASLPGTKTITTPVYQPIKLSGNIKDSMITYAYNYVLFRRGVSSQRPNNFILQDWTIDNDHKTLYSYNGNEGQVIRVELEKDSLIASTPRVSSTGSIIGLAFDVNGNLYGQEKNSGIFSSIDKSSSVVASNGHNFNNMTGDLGFGFPVSAAVPVTWGDFSIQQKSEMCTIEWATYSEINNSHFEIFRSNDAQTWSQVDQVQGNENSSVTRNYASRFNNRATGSEQYFIIKQVDFDGQESYSKVLILASQEKTSVKSFPNPSNGLIRLNSSLTEVRIVDLMGKEIYHKTDYQQGDLIDLQAVRKGVYSLQFLNKSGHLSSEKIILK